MNISALKSCPGVTDAMVDQVLALLIDFKPGRYEFEGGAYANAEEYTTVDRKSTRLNSSHTP